MLKYKVIVLGTIGAGDKIFIVSCDVVRYENDCIVFKKRINHKQYLASGVHDMITIMSVPQGASIVELQNLDL